MSVASESKPPASFSLKIGRWFEASATGSGVAAIPLVLVLLLIVFVARAASG